MALSQETIAIVTVGLALAGLDLTSDIATRSAARADAQANRVAIEANRAAIETAIRALQDSTATDRHALEERAAADRRAFQAEILKLTAGQAQLAAVLESKD